MKDEGENLVALLTPAGAAAIAVVRLKGPGVGRFLKEHFSASIRENRPIHGLLRDGTREIDDPVVVVSAGGRTADISLHGGPRVVRECMEIAARAGFQSVEANNGMDDAETTLERELLAALSNARTELAIRTLLAQPQHWLQFQNDSRTLPKPAVDGRVRQILENRALHWLLNPPRIAIVGIPNVGKSTLANAMFGQQRSITADIPGTTRDWVGDWANLDGLPVHLLDTPGQRESNDQIEQSAIAGSLQKIAAADLIILVLDPTQPLNVQLDLMHRHGNALLAINKSDMEARWDISQLTALPISALKGFGLDRLRTEIRGRFGCTDGALGLNPMWWTERQRGILQLAMDDPEALSAI